MLLIALLPEEDRGSIAQARRQTSPRCSDALRQVGRPGVLAVQLDRQPQVVDRIGVAQRVLVRDAVLLEQVEQRLVERLHAEFARALPIIALISCQFALQDLVGDQSAC